MNFNEREIRKLPAKDKAYRVYDTNGNIPGLHVQVSAAGNKAYCLAYSSPTETGSNGKGKMLDGQPLEGFDYEFRSYQLIPYEPRRYHFKRAYHRSATTTPSNQKSDVVNTRLLGDASKPSCRQSQEIITK